jgi:serine/threonine protein phosphatase PrpC
MLEEDPARARCFGRSRVIPTSFATASASFRSASQDRVVVHELSDAAVIVVADGAGGIPGGAVAAEAVVADVERLLREPEARVADIAAIVDLLRELDGAIERAPLAGETTGIVVVIRGDRVYGASCGDSSAWLVGERTHEDLTVDQHRKRRLGCGRAMPIAFERPMNGDVLVVGTDGLFGIVSPETICRHARRSSPTDAVAALIESARTHAGTFVDDIAVVIARCSR